VTSNAGVGGELSVSGNVEVGTANLFVDTTTGNVGVGTTDPARAFEITRPGGGAIINLKRSDFGTGQGALAFVNGYSNVAASIACARSGSEGGEILFYTVPNDTTQTSDNPYLIPERMRINKDGNVGIGTASPADQKLQVEEGGIYIKRSGDHSGVRDFDANKWIVLRRSGNKVSGEGPGISFQGSYYGTSDYNNHYAMIKAYGFDNNSTTARLAFYVNDGVSGAHLDDADLGAYVDYDSNGGQINFTGQHRTFIKDIPITHSELFKGLIVSANQNKYVKMDGGIEAGSNAITINESLPIVSLSNVTMDKKCFGVISNGEDPETREDRYGRLFCHFKKERGDTRIYINSVGEGGIWVVNTNGILESGDYITTSNVAGYGQKQESDTLKNYTVAKITMDCDFNPVTQPVQIIKKELQDVNYWVKTTYDNISEGEYSILPEKERRTVTETEYMNDDGETFTEQNEQSTYTERIQIIYQKIHEEKSKNEKEGYEFVERQELINVLDEHGQLQWEDDPSGTTEKAYKIRYLDADGNITDEANAVHIAAFVGCTYHCG